MSWNQAPGVIGDLVADAGSALSLKLGSNARSRQVVLLSSSQVDFRACSPSYLAQIVSEQADERAQLTG